MDIFFAWTLKGLKVEGAKEKLNEYVDAITESRRVALLRQHKLGCVDVCRRYDKGRPRCWGLLCLYTSLLFLNPSSRVRSAWSTPSSSKTLMHLPIGGRDVSKLVTRLNVPCPLVGDAK